MKTNIAALSLAALLTACGGGGGSSTTSTPTTDAITTASGTTATAAGATLIAASGTSTAYNLVADIGDSWKVNFDSTGNAYTITMLAPSQFGLTNSSTNTTGTYTVSTNGNFTTYTLGSAGTLTLDTRTKGLSGTLTIGSKTSTAAGTGYQVGDLTKLAGSYYFMYGTRNQSNGASGDRGKGQMKITGSTAYLCTNGTVNASNTCDAVAAGVTPELNTLSLALSNGVVIASNGGTEWGRIYIHASDLGKAFLIDRYGNNGVGVLRVGALYAVEVPKALTGTEGNGTWKCSKLGQSISQVAITGTALTGTDLTVANGGTWTETLAYNQIATPAGFFSVNGVLNTGTSAAASSRYNILPLSSTFVIAEDGANGTGLMTCLKQS